MAHPTSARAVLVIAGPTASGKSALAIAAAEEFGGVVINADSMQCYQDLRVLSARPSEEDEARVPHRLFGTVAAPSRVSAGTWCAAAVEEIENAWRDHRLPVVVGGTGLYLKSLMDGLSPIPEVSPGIRADTLSLLDEIGADALHARLAKADPASVDRIKPSDTQRLTRAWEVFAETGTPLSEFQNRAPEPPFPDATFMTLAVVPEVEDTDQALTDRFHQMLAEGAEDEVRALLARGLPDDHPVFTCIGVRQLAGYLAGEWDLDTATAQSVTATRQYAKRQRTWIRTQFHAGITLPAKYSESFNEKIFPEIRKIGLTGRN